METAELCHVFWTVDMGALYAFVLLGKVAPRLPPCLLRLTHTVAQRSLWSGWDSQAGDRFGLEVTRRDIGTKE